MVSGKGIWWTEKSVPAEHSFYEYLQSPRQHKHPVILTSIYTLGYIILITSRFSRASTGFVFRTMILVFMASSQSYVLCHDSPCHNTLFWVLQL